jgi:hypothetical protein
MTNSEDQPPPAVGAYWMKEEDYRALLQLFDDGDKMPPSWKEWLKMAEEMEQGLKVRRPWYKPGQRRTEKVRLGGSDREIWPTGLTSTAAPSASPEAVVPRKGEAGRIDLPPRPLGMSIFQFWPAACAVACRFPAGVRHDQRILELDVAAGQVRQRRLDRGDHSRLQ